MWNKYNKDTTDYVCSCGIKIQCNRLCYQGCVHFWWLLRIAFTQVMHRMPSIIMQWYCLMMWWWQHKWWDQIKWISCGTERRWKRVYRRHYIRRLLLNEAVATDYCFHWKGQDEVGKGQKFYTYSSQMAKHSDKISGQAWTPLHPWKQRNVSLQMRF